ncbi:MAG: hypothetical protein OHK0039_48840 [Bacteroidia bacterium]
MQAAGLQNDFKVYVGTVENAAAVIQKDQRIILYNEFFFDNVSRQGRWIPYAILAHEIGHHVNGHTLLDDGSRPDAELQADFFAGTVLARMGASLDETLAAVYHLTPETGSATHPPRAARITRVTEGWMSVSQSGYRRLPPATDTVPDLLPSTMMFIKGGTFQMGNIRHEGAMNEYPIREVQLADFFLAATELTFSEYDAYCDATSRPRPNDNRWGRDRHPVINVSWFDAIYYCNWRSIQEGLPPAYLIDTAANGTITVSLDRQSRGYRLPTEAEWEYAARQQGAHLRFGNGRDEASPSQINFNTNYEFAKPYAEHGENRERTVPIATFPANSLGLYDLSGNVAEWCYDWYSPYPDISQTNPTGPSKGVSRICRGGSWLTGPDKARTGHRGMLPPDISNNSTGFRLAQSAQ